MNDAIHSRRRSLHRRFVFAITASLILHLALLVPLATTPEPRTGTGAGGNVEVSIVAAPPPAPLSSGDEPVPDARRERASESDVERGEDPAGDPAGVADGSVGGLPGGVPGGAVGGEPGGELGGDHRISGTMVVKCVVAADGTLEDCRVLRPLPRVSAAVLNALETWRLPPLPRDDRPNAVDHVVSVRLLLPTTASR